MNICSIKKQRPTISLCMIVKNEEKNLNRLLDSVEGCFDQIVIVDTGSTDKTVEIAIQRGCEVHHFEWVNSFCKARNFAFSHATSDFIAWLDADDELHNRDGFIQWRDHAMQFVDMWFATYHYAVDSEKKPIISFVRERVFRRSINPTWKYDLHEGIVPKPEWSANYITTWAVNHLRDAEDVAQDRSRNLNILKNMKDIDSRMTFYYGKELYEAGNPFEALPVLEEAVKKHDIEHHDKILSYQYGSYAATACAQSLKEDQVGQRYQYLDRALQLAYEGMKLDPNRAEFYICAADTLVGLGRLREALPMYHAARGCINPKTLGGGTYQGPIYNFEGCYGEIPTLQMSKVYFNLGLLEDALREAKFCAEKWNNKEAISMVQSVEQVSNLVKLDNNQLEVEDVVITCPPTTAYEFDESLYQFKGMGGSETALIEMAKWIKEKTKRPVIVFNMRKERLIAASGVEYRPTSELNQYFSLHRPKAHIAWRHNIKITTAPTYLWCHDLFTPTVETVHNFDKFLALSEFHKNYTMGLQGVPESKIVLTRNGISPEKFKFERKAKDPNKLVWMSSPDRGLDRAMHVMDEVVKEFPEAKLHVYYGIEGLYKYGPQMSALADKLKQMMIERPYVVYHGFTEQRKMYHEVSDAVVWTHPNNFIETFCITALEMLALGIFPVTRRLGALKNTLAEAEKKGQAILLDHDCISEEEIQAYAHAVIGVLKEKRWESVSLDIEKHSWASVADEWIKEMNL